MLLSKYFPTYKFYEKIITSYFFTCYCILFIIDLAINISLLSAMTTRTTKNY